MVFLEALTVLVLLLLQPLNGTLEKPELVVFVGILAMGLAYVWVKGDLQWLTRVPRAATTPGNQAREAA